MTERLLAPLRVAGLCLLASASAAMALAPAAAWAEEEEQAAFSEAEQLLWMGDQLKAVKSPQVLEYEFEKSGTLEPGFKDLVVFTVHKVREDGLKSASLAFFTGERQFPVPPEEATDANPVLKVYLQGDVYEMNRLTDPEGKARERWRYFQRRIKFALADKATIEKVSIAFQGRSYEGKRISFAPYLDDPKREAFEKFAGKSYAVTVSDMLPGYLYEVSTVIPGEQEGAAPLISETLRLRASKPL